jgi:hypothetical protein
MSPMRENCAGANSGQKDQSVPCTFVRDKRRSTNPPQRSGFQPEFYCSVQVCRIEYSASKRYVWVLATHEQTVCWQLLAGRKASRVEERFLRRSFTCALRLNAKCDSREFVWGGRNAKVGVRAIHR